MLEYLNQNSGVLQVLIAILGIFVPSSLAVVLYRKYRSLLGGVELSIKKEPLGAFENDPYFLLTVEARTKSKKPVELSCLGFAYRYNGVYNEIPASEDSNNGRAIVDQPVVIRCWPEKLVKQLNQFSTDQQLYLYAKRSDGKEFVKSCGTVLELRRRYKLDEMLRNTVA